MQAQAIFHGGSVLEESIPPAKKRDRVVGRYHGSDLRGLTVRECAQLYAGVSEEREFDRYLAARGLALEALALRAVPDEYKQPEGRLRVDDAFDIVYHPDAVVIIGEGRLSFLEVSSQMDSDDDTREALKADQALTYAGCSLLGGDLVDATGAPIDGKVVEVRVLMMGLWEAQEIPYGDIEATARGRAEWLIEKARVVHRAAGLYAEGQHDEADAAAEVWDALYPFRTEYDVPLVPILDDPEVERVVSDMEEARKAKAEAEERLKVAKARLEKWQNEAPQERAKYRLKGLGGVLNRQRGASASLDKKRLERVLRVMRGVLIGAGIEVVTLDGEKVSVEEIADDVASYQVNNEYHYPRYYPPKARAEVA